MNENHEFPLNKFDLEDANNSAKVEPNIRYSITLFRMHRKAELLAQKDRNIQKKYQNTAKTHEESHLRVNIKTNHADVSTFLAAMHLSDEINPQTEKEVKYHLSYETITSEWLTNTITALTTDPVVMLNHIFTQLHDLQISKDVYFKGQDDGSNLIEHAWTAINTNQASIPTSHIHAIAFIMGDPNIFENIKKQKNTKENKARFAKQFLKRLEEFVNNPEKYLKKIITPKLIEALLKKEQKYGVMFQKYIVDNADKLLPKDIKYLKMMLTPEQLKEAVRKIK